MSAFYRSHRDAPDDPFQEQGSEDNNGDYGDGYAQIHNAVISHIGAVELLDHHRQREFFGGEDQNQRINKIIPGIYKYKDSLGEHGRLNDREYDLVEDPDFGTAVDPGALDQGIRHRGYDKLADEKYRRGIGRRGDDQGGIAVQQMEPVHELEIPDQA